MISLFKNNKITGFSLIEAMVGLGLMSAVGLGVMKLQSNQTKTQKSIDVDYEAKILASVLYDQLKTKGVCEATFQNSNFSSGNFNFSSITDAGGNVLFNAPQDYKGQNNIGLLRFVAEPQGFALSEDSLFREGSVRVAFEYQKTSGVLNNQNSYKKYISLPIRVKTFASNGNLHSCITASDDAIETSLKEFCESLNGIYEANNEICNLDPTAENTTLAIVEGMPAYQGISSTRLGHGLWDHKLSETYVDKNTGGVVEGSVTAQRNVILNSAPASSMDAINKSYLDSRLRCPNGQWGLMTSNGVRCGMDLRCASSLEYMSGINSDGTAVCLPLVTNSEECPNGGRLNIQANGSVGFECCTPECSGAGARCSNESFDSSNGCGVCQGTAPNVVEGTWTPWVDTGETRQTSECINNQIQTEKRQTRSCVANTTLASCQELTCPGSDNQWTLGTPINCGSTGWACRIAEVDTSTATSGYFPSWGTAINIPRLDTGTHAGSQLRPKWPVTVPRGNSWQQGYHDGCVESCRVYVSQQFSSAISVNGSEVGMTDPMKSITLTVSDIFFQDDSGYNAGPPHSQGDNSGFWCSCSARLHDKGHEFEKVRGGSLDRSKNENKRAQMTICTLNGDGSGSPKGPPSFPQCVPSKTCDDIRAEVCSGESVYKYNECGDLCTGNGTKSCVSCPAVKPPCPFDTYDMGPDEVLCNSNHQCLEGCYRYGTNCQQINVCWRRGINGLTCPIL